MIVETEAYLGIEDQASHARFGETPRNSVMFGNGGIAYVYLCYGIHNLFNVVTGRPGDPGAVLIRALSPLTGMANDMSIARGPGKLTRALQIDRGHNSVDLCEDKHLYVRQGPRCRYKIAVGPRIGIDYAGDWVTAPLRFWIQDHPAVSRAQVPQLRSCG